MRSRLLLTFLFGLFLLTAGRVAGVAAPMGQALSPGEVRAFALVETRCPTFSWTAVDAATGYELVVYPVPEESMKGSPDRSTALLEESSPALRMELPAGASSWTPSAERCLEAGEGYAWAIRTLSEDDGEAWSESRLFRVAEIPSPEEMREALDLLRRFEEEGRRSSAPAYGAVGLVNGEPSSRAIAAAFPGAIPAIDKVALSAELPDLTGATVGVQGKSKSADGIAGVFQNLATGNILSGQNATNEVFSVNNAGTVTAVAFAGDGSGLTGVGGGGGAAPVAVSAVSANLPETAGTVLSKMITAPAAGTLLIAAAVDVSTFDFDFVFCEVKVAGSVVTGSHMKIELEALPGNGDEDCTTVAALPVTAGTHLVEFVVNFDPARNTFLGAGTLWALWIP